MLATLDRIKYPNCSIGDFKGYSTAGNLIFSCYSIEQAYKDNKRKISCVPEGQYDLVVLHENEIHKYQHLFFLNVKGREGIKVIAVDCVNELLGSIALTKRRYSLDMTTQINLMESRTALSDFIEVCKTQRVTVDNKHDFKLIIKDLN